MKVNKIMDALTIIQMISALTNLSAKYLDIASQTGELTPEQTEDFKRKFQYFVDSDAWKIEKDPQ